MQSSDFNACCQSVSSVAIFRMLWNASTSFWNSTLALGVQPCHESLDRRYISVSHYKSDPSDTPCLARNSVELLGIKNWLLHLQFGWCDRLFVVCWFRAWFCPVFCFLLKLLYHIPCSNPPSLLMVDRVCLQY